VICDPRLFTEIKAGYGIIFVFAIDEVLQTWLKISIPNFPDIVRKVVRIEGPKIKVNFAINEIKTCEICGGRGIKGTTCPTCSQPGASNGVRQIYGS
jgi:hypothetical protein